MINIQLTSRQKMLLRSIEHGLRDGTIADEWTIFFDRGRIGQIDGIPKDLFDQVWSQATRADLDILVKRGLFLTRKYDRDGTPYLYSLDVPLILEVAKADSTVANRSTFTTARKQENPRKNKRGLQDRLGVIGVIFTGLTVLTAFIGLFPILTGSSNIPEWIRRNSATSTPEPLLIGDPSEWVDYEDLAIPSDMSLQAADTLSADETVSFLDDTFDAADLFDEFKAAGRVGGYLVFYADEELADKEFIGFIEENDFLALVIDVYQSHSQAKTAFDNYYRSRIWGSDFLPRGDAGEESFYFTKSERNTDLLTNFYFFRRYNSIVMLLFYLHSSIEDSENAAEELAQSIDLALVAKSWETEVPND